MLRLLCIFHRRSNKITVPSWPCFQAIKFQIYALKYSLLCPFIFSSRLSLVPFICHNSRKLTTFFGAIMYNYVPHNLSSDQIQMFPTDWINTAYHKRTLSLHWQAQDNGHPLKTWREWNFKGPFPRFADGEQARGNSATIVSEIMKCGCGVKMASTIV